MCGIVSPSSIFAFRLLHLLKAPCLHTHTVTCAITLLAQLPAHTVQSPYCVHCCRLWNTVRGSMVHSVHTGSQICGLAWSESVNELLSTHGYADNTINVWKAPSLTKAASLTGHTKRVLFLAMSPDGQTAATGAGRRLPVYCVPGLQCIACASCAIVFGHCKIPLLCTDSPG